MMGSRFQIAMERAGADLNLKLLGRFDRASADQLIEFLRENGRDVNVAVIETSDLDSIDPNGQDVFQKRLHALKDLCYRLVFYGKHAPELAPTWIEYF